MGGTLHTMICGKHESRENMSKISFSAGGVQSKSQKTPFQDPKPIFSWSGPQSFDGTQQILQKSSEDLRLTGAFTVMVWVYPTERRHDWARIFGKGQSGPRNYGLWLQSNGRPLSQIYGVRHGGGCHPSSTVPLRKWTHMAVSFTENGSHRLYINGKCIMSTPTSGRPATSSDPLTIGRADFHTGVVGQVRDARVYKQALSCAEVAERFDVGWRQFGQEAFDKAEAERRAVLSAGLSKKTTELLLDTCTDASSALAVIKDNRDFATLLEKGNCLPTCKLERMRSCEAVQEWTREVGALPYEYQRVADQIVIVPELMGTSRMQIDMKELLREGEPPLSFKATLVQCIQHAFNLESEAAVQELFLSTSRFGIENSAGNPYTSGMKLFRDLQWRGKYLHAALYKMRESDSTGLAVLMAYMNRASNSCHSAKVWFLSDVMRRAMPDPLEAASKDASGRAAQARQRLFTAGWYLVDELKEKAFMSTFEEPTKMYFRAVGDQVGFDHVQVHGANWYLALLMSTLKVSCPRQPHIHDGCTWFADFLEADLGDALNQYWQDQYLGRSFEGLSFTRSLRVQKKMPAYTFIFQGSNPKEMANNALNPFPENAARRAHFARYLERFAHYFSEDFVLERLWQCLFQTCEADLAIYFEHFRRERGVEEEDVRYWVHDPEDFSIRRECLTDLFSAVGLVKQNRRSPTADDNDPKRSRKCLTD